MHISKMFNVQEPLPFTTCNSNSSSELKLAKFHTSAEWCFLYHPGGSFQPGCACIAAEWRSKQKDNHHLHKQRNQCRYQYYGSMPSIGQGSFCRLQLSLLLRAVYCERPAHKPVMVPYRNLYRLRYFY